MGNGQLRVDTLTNILCLEHAESGILLRRKWWARIEAGWRPRPAERIRTPVKNEIPVRISVLTWPKDDAI